MRVTALKPITPRTVSKFENSDLWYLPSLCTSLYDIFINWERTSLAYDKVQMTKARLTLSPGSRVMLVPIPLVMRGVPAQIFFAVPGDKTWPAEIVWDLVQLTLDHPLQVELELDLLAGRGQMEQEAKCCQRPKRPHQNFHFSHRLDPNIRIKLNLHFQFWSQKVGPARRVSRWPKREREFAVHRYKPCVHTSWQQ